jgi:GTP-binding protein
MEEESDNLKPLFDTIMNTIPPPAGESSGVLQILVTNIDYDNYVGRLAIVRIFSGTVKVGNQVAMVKGEGEMQKTKVSSLYSFQGLDRIAVEEASAGEIIALAELKG